MDTIYTVLIIGNALINITLIVCVLLAAIHFNSWGLLWFWLIPALNSMQLKSSKTENNKE